MLGTDKALQFVSVPPSDPLFPRYSLVVFKRKARSHPWVFSFPLYKFHPSISPGNTTKAYPKSQRGCLGSCLDDCNSPQQPSIHPLLCLPEQTPCCSQSELLKALSKGSSDLLSCLVGMLPPLAWPGSSLLHPRWLPCCNLCLDTQTSSQHSWERAGPSHLESSSHGSQLDELTAQLCF